MDKKYGASSKSDQDRQNEMNPDHADFKPNKARRVANRKRRAEFGSGKKGKARAAAAIAKKAATEKLQRIADGASMFGGKARKEKHAAKIAALKVGKKKAAGASMKGVKDADTKYMPVIDREKDAMNKNGSSMYGKKHGSSMYGKKHGSSMSANQDRSASMDDYSHEKKLKADGRYEAAHGKMANAKNDFDHAHALKKDAHYDAKGRHAIMKHMKGFK
jgi:hypothetical protein